MSKKGLSVEEKRTRMLEFFYEKQDFFQLKDIEKGCSQEKGIVLNTIKDILQSLVEDGLVDSERIGTSLYYWSLPSKALKKRDEAIRSGEQELAAELARQAEMSQRVETCSQSQSESDEAQRAELESQYSVLSEQCGALRRELDSYKENDPQMYEDLRAGIQVAKKACNRWVENIFSLRSWLKNKFRVDEATIEKQFEIPSDLDYIS